jgi:FAD/FMN-containing dehydrogenase
MLKFLDAHTEWAGLDRIHILAIRSPAGETTRAFRPLREFRGSRYFGIGVFYTVPRGNRRLLDVAQAAQRALLEECLRVGGRPYLCGAHDLDESGLAAIYGEEFRTFEVMRQALDPAGLFNRPPDSTRLSEA